MPVILILYSFSVSRLLIKSNYFSEKKKIISEDDDGFPDVMPKLVPFVPTNKSVKERLGSSRSASNGQIENRVMPVQTLVRPNFKAKNSIQKRLGKNFVNPAVAERNRITVHALKSFASSAQKSLAAPDETNGKFLLDAFTSALELAAPDKKYDMRIQKEICEIQVSFSNPTMSFLLT